MISYNDFLKLEGLIIEMEYGIIATNLDDIDMYNVKCDSLKYYWNCIGWTTDKIMENIFYCLQCGAIEGFDFIFDTIHIYFHGSKIKQR